VIERSAKQIWDTTLGELQLQVTEANYETWLKNTTGLDFQNHNFTVGVPSVFVSEWLTKRLSSLIKKTLMSVTGQKKLQVQFVVTPGTPPKTSTEKNTEELPAAPTQIVDDSPYDNRNGYSPQPQFKPHYTFESFIVGSSNRLAYAAALGVAENPGHSYNPLFIYGGVGLGKTHLLQAIGNIIAKNNGARIVYVSGEQFTNEFINAIRGRTTEEFRNKFRGVDLLLVDDIQFISGKEQTQEGFFHTFNDLHNGNRQIVLTSDRPPKAMALLEERLRSRFEWGLLADIQPPDLETRIAILQYKADNQGAVVSPEVIDFLAHRIQSNIRELEGSLNRIVAYSRLTRTTLTPQLVEQILHDMTVDGARRTLPEPQVILEAVARYFNLTIADLNGKNRDRQLVRVRQIAMYLIREETHLALSHIGDLLGGRDHSTIVHGYQKIAADINSDHQLRRDVLAIRETVYTRTSMPAP